MYNHIQNIIEGEKNMSLKKDFKKLNEFTDNPFDATYRPEKEMKRFFIGLMVTLPFFIGFCCEFYILVSGPLFIYWIVMYVKAWEYWKALKWKKIWFILPTVLCAALGIYLCATKGLLVAIGWFFRNVLGFN